MLSIQKWRGSLVSLVAKGVMILVLGAMVACYGRFPLTNTVYRFNGQVGKNFKNKTLGNVTRQVVFWVFVIIPVYHIAMLGDAIILNLIEFWTGSTVEVAVQERLEDGTLLTLTPLPGGQEAELVMSKNGEVLATFKLVRVSPTACEVRDSTGHLLGKTLRNAEGDLLLADAQGKTVSMVKADDLALLLAR